MSQKKNRVTRSYIIYGWISFSFWKTLIVIVYNLVLKKPITSIEENESKKSIFQLHIYLTKNSGKYDKLEWFSVFTFWSSIT